MASVTFWIIASLCTCTFLHTNGYLIKQQSLCKTTHYTDECGYVGLLWNCSGLGLSTLPSEISTGPYNLAIDISQNDFRVVSNESFLNISLQVSLKVKAIYLRHNKLQSIKGGAFSQFKNLCVLDVSGCGLQKSSLESQSFASLPNVKFLSIHSNSFQHGGYPDLEIPRLSALQNLSIDVFSGFHFNDNFTNLKKLSSVVFHTMGSPFHLTNVTFRGLIDSPIHYLDMRFTNNAYCDISEDLFCCFPFIKGIYFTIGEKCELDPVLRSLKCLQNRTLDYLQIPDNTKTFSGNEIILNEWNCEYLFNICAKYVDLGGNKISGVSVDPWKTMLGQCIEILYLSGNKILRIDTYISVHLFSFYPKLRDLYVEDHNILPPVIHPVYVENHNILPPVIHPVYVENHNILPPVIHPVVSLLYLKKIHFTYRLSPQLQLIDYTDHFIHSVHFQADFTIIGRALEELFISNTNFPINDMTPFQTPELRVIDISNNDCSKIPNIFSSSHNLASVKASKTKINFSAPKSQHLFKNLSKLQTLDLSYNAIETLPKYLLSDQNKSIYILNLDNNLLSSIPFTVSMLTNLSRLYVRHNRISFFQSSDIAVLSELHKVKIFIEGNPISCTCSHLSSLKWMKENPMRFGDWRITQCLQLKQTLSQLFREKTFRTFELNCQTKDWLIYSSIVLFLIVLIIVLLGTMTKYRVHVDYVILRLRHRWKGVMNSKHKNDYGFDVFISFSEHDYEWVVNTMYHELTKRNVKVSLPDKDFIPGLSKADEMLRCIDDSRKVVFVVTETFLKSGWESYAVQMTVTHAFHNNRERSMVVLMKDNVPIIKMPRDLRYVWWSLEVIKQADFENNLDCFWDHIAILLQSQ
ncbi:toll-like receptor 1 [Ostrea edulis]|uniref:toll-like receptor 1 n=1 Tax=Ostrea edulis TaxID=37623 RepID=UPI0024AFAF0D|nr:toll-like receptor 1 [Ostrea edulis]